MWIKFDGRELKVNTNIKLAGRVGTAIRTHTKGENDYFKVEWGSPAIFNMLDLKQFPDLEIWIEEPKISKEAAMELKAFLGKEPYRSDPTLRAIMLNVLNKIDSIIE